LYLAPLYTRGWVGLPSPRSPAGARCMVRGKVQGMVQGQYHALPVPWYMVPCPACAIVHGTMPCLCHGIRPWTRPCLVPWYKAGCKAGSAGEVDIRGASLGAVPRLRRRPPRRRQARRALSLSLRRTARPRVCPPPQAGRQTGRQAGRQTGRQAGGRAGRQAGRRAGRPAGSQAGSQAGRLAGRRAGLREHPRTLSCVRVRVCESPSCVRVPRV
jgi:hypothetical protein